MNGPSSVAIRYGRSRPVRFLMQVVWPAFVAAALSSGLAFAAIDPLSLTLFGSPVEAHREAVYTAGFLALWALHAGACAVTWWITAHDAERAAGRRPGAAATAARVGLS